MLTNDGNEADDASKAFTEVVDNVAVAVVVAAAAAAAAAGDIVTIAVVAAAAAAGGGGDTVTMIMIMIMMPRLFFNSRLPKGGGNWNPLRYFFTRIKTQTN